MDKIKNINEVWNELNDIIMSYVDEDHRISIEKAKELIRELDQRCDMVTLDPDEILTGDVEEYNEDGIISYSEEYYDSYDDDEYDQSY